jgi:hypothetical protein
MYTLSLYLKFTTSPFKETILSKCHVEVSRGVWSMSITRLEDDHLYSALYSGLGSDNIVVLPVAVPSLVPK